ncbi:MAG: hypothetical protein PHF84_00515 [bacterium]|nr:hypothetical protein [bacterium]
MEPKKVEIPLGQLLINEKKISNEQLLNALEEQRKTGDRLGHTLINLGYITEDDLIRILERQFGIPAVKVNIQMLNPLIVKLIPETICRKYRLIPILLNENRLTVAATNPYDLSFVDQIKFTTDYSIEVVLSPEKSILDAIHVCFGKREYDWEDNQDKEEEYHNYKISAAKMLDMLFNQAYNMSAREIHLEYFENRFTILFLTTSSVIKSRPVQDQYYKHIAANIKSLAKLPLHSKEFSEGIFRKNISNREFMIRVLVFPTQAGENILLKFP